MGGTLMYQWRSRCCTAPLMRMVASNFRHCHPSVRIATSSACLVLYTSVALGIAWYV